MAIELEAKIRVDDVAAVRATLLEIGASKLGHRLELNIYFDTTDRKLLAGDEGLRIRSIWSLDGNSAAAAKHVITFKGRQEAGSALKSREEIEFNVDQNEPATELLKRLGYHAELGFEKRRESWSFAGCAIELDELPLLGTFVEVEGPSRDAVMGTLSKLGLVARPLITESYISMMSREATRLGLHDRVVRF